MNNSDVDFVIGLVDRVKSSGCSFTRNLLRDCYFEDLLKRGAAEVPAVSEKWIDYYWNHLSAIPYERLEKAAAHPQKLAKLLIEALGK